MTLDGYRATMLETAKYTNAELSAAWGYRREQVEHHLGALDPDAVRRATEIGRGVFADLPNHRAVAVALLASRARSAANVLASLESLESEGVAGASLASQASQASLASLASLALFGVRAAVPVALSALVISTPMQKQIPKPRKRKLS
jgi:hypothetical protein